ncbi:MAG TPA: SpoIIE family protein phosphatase [Bryobacteraceae bacterium]|nr:SpoIIE family protein phosphatase [Bryobacteraceae bacterium]
MTIPLGRVEKAFALAVVCYVIALLIPGRSGMEGTLEIAVALLGLWAFARIWRASMRQLLWRLRNRLIVAYLLIGLVPVILVTALVGLGGYLVLGQVSVHLLESQLERTTGVLQGAISLMAHSGPTASAELRRNLPPALERTFPGLQIIETDGAARYVWPENSTLSEPAGKRDNASGLLLKDGLLYGWAHAMKGSRRVTALFPLSRDFLGDLAPNLGESIIVDRLNRRNLHPPAPGGENTYNRVPPAVNPLDAEIWWVAPVTMTTWDGRRTDIEPFISLRTRVSAVLRTVFTQDVDFAASMIPFLFFGAGLMFLLAEIVSFVVGVSITRSITGAVHDLYEGTLRVRSGEFTHRIPIQGSDQLGELSTSFNEMTENLERLVQVEKDRQRIQSDLEIAREVQNQLYPRDVPEVPGLQITAARTPARVVSGDYYDFQRLARGEVAVAMGDVAGKGISAALLMATIQSSVRMEMRAFLETRAAAPGVTSTRQRISISAVVSQLNKHLYEFTAAEKYATFFSGIYEAATSTLTYTNAGHLPPMLVRDGRCSRLEVNGTVVGAFPFSSYEETRLGLEPGDLLVLFTDGITEAEDAYGEMYGEDRLSDLVCRNAHRDNDVIIAEIMQSVRQWTGSDELQDDMTLLLIRRQ